MINPIADQYSYFIDREGIDAVVNETTNIKCLIKEIEDSTENDCKWIFAPIDTIKQGDLIETLGVNWLVTKEEVSFNSVYRKAKIELVNNDTNFNFEGDIVSIPSIIEVTPMQFDTNEYITLYNASMRVQVSDDVKGRRISLNQRVLYQGQAWVISGKDKSKNGLITFSCELDQINDNDDMENEVPDRWLYEEKHEYVIMINDGSDINVTEGIPYLLDISVTDLGFEMTELPSLTYASSDETILTISDGTITPILVGDAIVTITLTDNPSVSATVNVKVDEPIIEDNYAIDITSSNGIETYIRVGQTLTYTANITNNDVIVNDKVVNWSVINQDGSNNTYVTILASTDTTIQLKATSNSDYVGKYVSLSAELGDDETVSDVISLLIKSIF